MPSKAEESELKWIEESLEQLREHSRQGFARFGVKLPSRSWPVLELTACREAIADTELPSSKREGLWPPKLPKGAGNPRDWSSAEVARFAGLCEYALIVNALSTAWAMRLEPGNFERQALAQSMALLAAIDPRAVIRGGADGSRP